MYGNFVSFHVTKHRLHHVVLPVLRLRILIYMFWCMSFLQISGEQGGWGMRGALVCSFDVNVFRDIVVVIFWNGCQTPKEYPFFPCFSTLLLLIELT